MIQFLPFCLRPRPVGRKIGPSTIENNTGPELLCELPHTASGAVTIISARPSSCPAAFCMLVSSLPRPEPIAVLNSRLGISLTRRARA
jgi:hypothetical protein